MQRQLLSLPIRHMNPNRLPMRSLYVSSSRFLREQTTMPPKMPQTNVGVMSGMYRPQPRVDEKEKTREETIADKAEQMECETTKNYKEDPLHKKTVIEKTVEMASSAAESVKHVYEDLTSNEEAEREMERNSKEWLGIPPDFPEGEVAKKPGEKDLPGGEKLRTE